MGFAISERICKIFRSFSDKKRKKEGNRRKTNGDITGSATKSNGV